MNSVNMVDYAVIGLYAGLMVLVGLYVMRFNRSAAEYFRGGSRVPWLVAGLSCFMSGFSAWTFTGAAGVASLKPMPGAVVLKMVILAPPARSAAGSRARSAAASAGATRVF